MVEHKSEWQRQFPERVAMGVVIVLFWLNFSVRNYGAAFSPVQNVVLCSAGATLVLGGVALSCWWTARRQSSNQRVDR